MNNIEMSKIDKKEFLELYEKAKKGEVDVYQLPNDVLEKMYILLEEEIRIKERDIEILKEKLGKK